MIDCKNLCKAIGLHEETFYISHSASPDGLATYIMTSYNAGEQMSPEELKTEEDVLNAAIEMYRNMIASLLEEADLMINFRNTFYGEPNETDTTGDNNDK